MRRTFCFAAVLLACASLSAWHNGGDKAEQPPKFGTHDYIAYKGLDRAPAAQVAWVKQHLVAYFIGTEAPDTNKKIPGVTEGGYHDSLQCHCILFDAELHPTKTHARDRIREEFDRAVAAKQGGQLEGAAFFAGAMGHYVGDLSQFCHVIEVERDLDALWPSTTCTGTPADRRSVAHVCRRLCT